MLLQRWGLWPYCYSGQHAAWLLAGPGGDMNMVYAPEFKSQRAPVEVWFFLTFGSPMVNYNWVYIYI